MHRPPPVRLVGLVTLVLLIGILGTLAVPPLVLRDAHAPAHVARFVEDARADLFREIDDVLPVRLRFIAARCRTDGGALLLFEHWEPPYLGIRYSYAMSGTWPPASWGGGIRVADLAGDPEIAAFLRSDEVPCE